MKKLTKLGITPEKIMKNEDLINMKGGYGMGDCGGGHWWTYICWFNTEPGAPIQGPGIVCAWWEMEDGCGALARHYPQMDYCDCTAQH